MGEGHQEAKGQRLTLYLALFAAPGQEFSNLYLYLDSDALSKVLGDMEDLSFHKERQNAEERCAPGESKRRELSPGGGGSC